MSTRVARIAALLAAFALAPLAGCSGPLNIPQAREFERYAEDASREYAIGAGDVLGIDVWQQPTLTIRELVVRLDGKISFPLLDDVQAAGLTANELKQVLTERLSEYLTTPNVTVVVKAINSKLIYMMGEVARVGPIRLRSQMRVVDALSSAGGFKPFADQHKVKVIRHNGAGAIEFLFDYPSFASGQNLEQNILLLSGDRIVVPEQGPFWR